MKIRNILVTLFAIGTIFAAANDKKNVASAAHFDVNSLVFIEEENDLGLGFDTAEYLPENFDPYSGHISLKAINYIDGSDEIELGFDTSEYLLEGFDPYVQ